MSKKVASVSRITYHLSRQKGFALISVLVLGFVISLIAGTTFLIVKNGLLMTDLEIRYNIAEKTADYGITM
jgi:Tfp pilus assembly protein PilX